MQDKVKSENFQAVVKEMYLKSKHIEGTAKKISTTCGDIKMPKINETHPRAELIWQKDTSPTWL